MREYLVLRVVAKLILPFVLLFALYTQFHGELGPGGGFQAGVIFAAGVILYALVFGQRTAKRAVPVAALAIGAPLGVLLYAAVGVAGLVAGGAFLEYGVLGHDPVLGNELGISLIELGVGISVASVMILIFYAFGARR